MVASAHRAVINSVPEPNDRIAAPALPGPRPEAKKAA